MHSTAQEHARLWELTDLAPLAETPTAWLFTATQHSDRRVVLKCLTEAGQRFEGTAPDVLRAFNGHGAVRLLAASDACHLIEHCPGPSLGPCADDVAIPILAEIALRLQMARPARPPNVPSLEERCTALDRAPTALQGDQIARARALSHRLLQSGPQGLLHGDLHHENVLRMADGDWRAIDPQGVWGDPAYEVANIFANPLDHPEITLDEGRPHRLAQAFGHRLGFAPARILAWAYIHSLIGAVWNVEDGQDPSHRLAIADRIAQAMPDL